MYDDLIKRITVAGCELIVLIYVCKVLEKWLT